VNVDGNQVLVLHKNFQNYGKTLSFVASLGITI